MKLVIIESDLHKWYLTKIGPIQITQVYPDYCVWRNKSGNSYGSSWNRIIYTAPMIGSMWRRNIDASLVKVVGVDLEYKEVERYNTIEYYRDQRLLNRIYKDYLFKYCEYCG